MALATRPKPKVQHKKRKAMHHRQTKHYMKTYWPYLPMVAILGLGYVADRTWPDSLNSNLQLDTATGSVTRLDALLGTTSQWPLVAVITISAVAFAIFTARYWYRIHKAINKSQYFIAHHLWLDVVLVIVFTTGAVLTRAVIV